MKRIAIIAGEASGDLLAARLILALRKLHPDAVFEGIAGPEMQAAGCVSFYPLEKLSVMGLTEVLKHLPELLRIRRELFKYWQNNPVLEGDSLQKIEVQVWLDACPSYILYPPQFD